MPVNPHPHPSAGALPGRPLCLPGRAGKPLGL